MEKKKDDYDFLNQKISSSSPINIFRRYSVADVRDIHHQSNSGDGFNSPSTNFKHRVAENKIIKKLKVLEFVNEKREEFQNKLSVDGGASKLIKTKDKFSFVLGVLNSCIIAYISGKYPLYIPHFYAIEFLILFILRIFLYKRKKLHYFLFDFCYFANLMLLCYIYVVPNKQWFFIACFCISNGPLLGAVLPYRNSMVFHSLDKSTSVLIHLWGSIVTYSLRWCPDFLFSEKNSPYSTSTSWSDFYVYPVLLYVLWQAVYFFYVGKYKNKTIKENNYTTSLSFLSKVKEGHKPPLVSRYLNFATPNNRLYFFIFSQFAYTCLTMVPCILYYKYQLLHTTYLLFTITISLWNGANFYIEYFSNHYVSQMKEREERWKKIIINSIGNTNFSTPNSPVIHPNSTSTPPSTPISQHQHQMNSRVHQRRASSSDTLTSSKDHNNIINENQNNSNYIISNKPDQ